MDWPRWLCRAGNDVLHALTSSQSVSWEALIVLRDWHGNSATAGYGQFRQDTYYLERIPLIQVGCRQFKGITWFQDTDILCKEHYSFVRRCRIQSVYAGYGQDTHCLVKKYNCLGRKPKTIHWEKNVVLIDYPGWVQRLLSQLAYVISHFICSELAEYRKYSSSHASV